MKKFRIAYFGSPDFSADFLEKILLDKSLPIKVKLVVTQPDQPVGRKQIITASPVKQTAHKYRVEVFECSSEFRIQNSESKNKKILNSKFNSQFLILDSKLKKIDLALVYAYGDLIPKEILSLPKYGFWNIHPSLLPKYRGPSPIATPLINGETTTGVTIIKMDEEIDHGPIIAQQSLTIEKTDKRPDLEKKLTDLAYKMFKKIIGERSNFFTTWDTPLPAGRVPTGDKKIISEPFISQNHKEATFTKKLTKQDGFIDFEKLKKLFLHPTNYELQTIYNLFRGLYPWPGLWTLIKPIQLRQLDEAKRLKITELSLRTTPYELRPIRVQLEGKKEVDFEAFNKAYKIF